MVRHAQVPVVSRTSLSRLEELQGECLVTSLVYQRATGWFTACCLDAPVGHGPPKNFAVKQKAGRINISLSIASRGPWLRRSRRIGREIAIL